jgi:hypothetical protein
MGDLQIGDGLLGFAEEEDEDPRVLEHARVEAVRWSRQQAWRLLTDRGIEILTTADHLWLSVTKLEADAIASSHVLSGPFGTEVVFPSGAWTPTRRLTSGHWLFLFDTSLVDHEDLMIPGNFLMALPVKVTRVEELQEQRDVVEVQTSSRTYFANGLATHNGGTRSPGRAVVLIQTVVASGPGRRRPTDRPHDLRKSSHQGAGVRIA